MEKGDIWAIVEDLRKRVEDLENGPKKQRKKSKTKGDPGSSAAAQVRDVFLGEYERVHGHKYIGFGAKENGQVANWLTSVSLAEALEYAALYPHWKQKKVVAAGHPFWMLPAYFVELVAHRKRYPKIVEEIARARARERFIGDVAGKDEEVKLHGQLAKGRLSSQISFGGIGQISHQDGTLVPVPRDAAAGGEPADLPVRGASESGA